MQIQIHTDSAATRLKWLSRLWLFGGLGLCVAFASGAFNFVRHFSSAESSTGPTVDSFHLKYFLAGIIFLSLGFWVSRAVRRYQSQRSSIR